VHQGVMSQRFLKNLAKVEKALGLQHRLPEIREID